LRRAYSQNELTHCRTACASVGQPEIAMMSYNPVVSEDAGLGAEPSFSPAVATRAAQAGAPMSKWLKRSLVFSLSCSLAIMSAQGGYAYAADSPPVAGQPSPRPEYAAPQLETVDRAQCVAQESALERRGLEPSRFSAERRLGANDPSIGNAHIRWIVSGLPDAGGTVRYIGPTAHAYPGSPFWRHPVNVSVQVVANATVVKQKSRTVEELSDPRDSTVLQALTELTDELCHAPECVGR
jgi:hypothetical protein